MDCSSKLIINGGNPLFGRVKLSGSKNGALPIIAAALLMGNGVTTLENVPDISDIHTMAKMIERLGAKVNFDVTMRTMIIDASVIAKDEPPCELANAMRASFYVAGPLLARLGSARLPQPGGCSIGSRPVSYIVEAFKGLGVTSIDDENLVTLKSSGLVGAEIVLDPKYCSPGATFNVVMAATLAKGKTVLKNASVDPEVKSFCEFLVKSGAKINGIGTKILEIEGVSELNGVKHEIISDRIEGGTYLIAGLATKGDVEVYPLNPQDIGSLLDILTEMGAKISYTENGVRAEWVKGLTSSSAHTTPFPGFPTDLQPPLVVLMAMAKGVSTLNEEIYDGRLNYTNELCVMGASVDVSGGNSNVLIMGVEELVGREVCGTDMRAGAALVIAALSAKGASEVTGMDYIVRGYEDIAGKMRAVGADIKLVKE